MKTGFCLSLIGLLVLSASLSACTVTNEPPQASPSHDATTPASSPSESASVSPFETHSEYLSKFEEPTEVVSQVEGLGSAILEIGDLPAEYDSVGFIVSCTEPSSWEIQFSDGTSLGGSDCGDANSSGTDSVSVPIGQLREETARLKISDDVDVWATVFATVETE